MSLAQVVYGDLHITGTMTAGALTPSGGSVTNASVAAAAAIQASKLEHQLHLTYGQSGTAASATIPIHCGYGAGTIVSIKAFSVAAAVGVATVVIDLKKNGTTVLSSTITLDNANTAYVPEAGSLSTTTFNADDVLTLVITATAGGGTLPTGLGVTVILRENAAP